MRDALKIAAAVLAWVALILFVVMCVASAGVLWNIVIGLTLAAMACFFTVSVVPPPAPAP